MKQFLLSFFILTTVAAFSQQNRSAPITIGEKTDIYSNILKEKRSCNIYLPEGYNSMDTTRYPVVYLLDGGMDEDFLHIAGLYQFASFPWIEWCKPSIVVGIINTIRRRDMTFPTHDTAMKRLYPESGGSEKFIEFIKGELQPYINSHYKTSPEKTLIGQSFGGLLAALILYEYPDLFDRYFIVSPSLWWDDGALLKKDFKITGSDYSHHTKIFIAAGKEGLTPGAKPHVMEVDANLLADKLHGGKSSFVKVFFDYLPDEDHATILHRAVLDGLKMMK